MKLQTVGCVVYKFSSYLIVNCILRVTAYSSFLQSIRQTTTETAVPLLDSDSEGIEEEVAAGGRERGPLAPHHHDQPSNPPPITTSEDDSKEKDRVEGETIQGTR